MTITGAIVLFAVIWFMTLFVMLPQKIRSQEEDGNVVPGTPASAPVDPQLKRKAIITTIVTVILWSAVMAVIMLHVITLDDIYVFGPRGHY